MPGISGGGMIYEALAQAAHDSADHDEPIVPWNEYQGIDREVYDRAYELLENQGVDFSGAAR